MAATSFAADSSDAERGTSRSDTFETLVAEAVGTSTPSCPATCISTLKNANTTSTSAESLKRPDWTKVPRLDDLARYPKGLLRLAAQQTEFHNGSIHRRFEQEGELLIHYWEYQVIFAASRVGEWHAKHPEAGRRAPTPVRQRSAEVCDGDEHHILLEELEYAWFRHHRLMMAQKEKKTLLGVHWEEVRGLYGSFLPTQDMTDDDAFLPAYAPIQDHCSTAPEQAHLPIRNLLYSHFSKWLQEKMPILRFSEDSGGFLLEMRPLSLALEIFQIFSSSSLILVPIGILLFAGLDERGKFGVVVASVAVFCAVVVLGGPSESAGSGHGFGLLHGVVAAYTAVLSAFVFQLES